MGNIYCIFDTETSGFHQEALPFEHPDQGRIMQFAAVLIDENFKERASICVYNRDQDFNINPGALGVHGITKDMTSVFGLQMRTILDIFQDMLQQATIVSGFNVAFDKKLITTEAALNGKFIQYPATSFCVMEFMTGLCKLPSKRQGNGKYKWPKLSEAYKFAFGEEMPNAHDAMGDVRATIKLLSWLSSKKYI